MFQEQKDREKVYSVQIDGQRIDFTLELLDKIKNGQVQGEEIKKVYHLITKDGRIDISKEAITNRLSKQIISRQTEDVEKQQGASYRERIAGRKQIDPGRAIRQLQQQTRSQYATTPPSYGRAIVGKKPPAKPKLVPGTFEVGRKGKPGYAMITDATKKLTKGKIVSAARAAERLGRKLKPKISQVLQGLKKPDVARSIIKPSTPGKTTRSKRLLGTIKERVSQARSAGKKGRVGAAIGAAAAGAYAGHAAGSASKTIPDSNYRSTSGTKIRYTPSKK